MHWSRDRWLVATTVVSGGAVLVGYVGFTALLLDLLGLFGVFVGLLFGCLLFAFLVAGPPLTLRGVGANVVTAPVVVVLSRAREYAADRGAVALTGDAGALASALQTLTADDASPPTSDARDLGVVSAFCVVSPTSAPLPWLHPSTERRIARLRRLERTVETT